MIPQESTGISRNSGGIHRNQQESTGIPAEYPDSTWNGTGMMYNDIKVMDPGYFQGFNDMQYNLYIPNTST